MRGCVWEGGRGAVQRRVQAEVMGTGLKSHLESYHLVLGLDDSVSRGVPASDASSATCEGEEDVCEGYSRPMALLCTVFSQASSSQGLRARALICPGSCASPWAIGYRRLLPSTVRCGQRLVLRQSSVRLARCCGAHPPRRLSRFTFEPDNRTLTRPSQRRQPSNHPPSL